MLRCVFKNMAWNVAKIKHVHSILVWQRDTQHAHACALDLQAGRACRMQHSCSAWIILQHLGKLSRDHADGSCFGTVLGRDKHLCN